MLLRALLFSMITFGLTMVVSLLVALLIKTIAVFIQISERRGAQSTSKQ